MGVPESSDESRNQRDEVPPIYRTVRRIIVVVIGGTIIAIGVVLFVLPGPGLPVLLLGLGILALEFYWAKRWLVKTRRMARKTGLFRKKRRSSSPESGDS